MIIRTIGHAVADMCSTVPAAPGIRNVGVGDPDLQIVRATGYSLSGSSGILVAG
jgi:hypothetical protein